MSLSQSVLDSLQEAESHLRNALAFAARQERPSTCQLIASLVSDIDKVRTVDEVLDTLDDLRSSFSKE